MTVVPSPKVSKISQLLQLLFSQLNDVPLLNIHRMFMMDGIDQNVSSVLSLHTMNTERFITRTGLPAATTNGIYSDRESVTYVHQSCVHIGIDDIL